MRPLTYELHNFVAPLPLGIILIGIVVFLVLVASAREPDPEGARPFAVYTAIVMLLAAFVMLSAGYLAVGQGMAAALVDADESVEVGFGGTGAGDDREALIDGTVQAGALAVAAGFAYWYHRRRAGESLELLDGARTGIAGVRRAYLASIAFVFTITAVVAGAIAVHDVYAAVQNDLSDLDAFVAFDRPVEGNGREVAMAHFVAAGALAALSLIFRRAHLDLLDPLRAGNGGPDDFETLDDPA